VQVGPAQQAHEGLVLAGDQRIQQHRRGRGDGAGAQFTHVHEGAGRQLELLGQPAGEDQALRRIGRVDECADIADAVEALVVEGLAGQLGLAKVPGHHIDATQPQLELAAAGGHHLQLDTRKRQADQAHPLSVPVGAGGGGCGLGRAPAGVEHDALAGGAHGQVFLLCGQPIGAHAGMAADEGRLHALVQVVGQAGAAIGHQREVLEEAAAQRVILFHRRGQRGVAGRHVGVVGR